MREPFKYKLEFTGLTVVALAGGIAASIVGAWTSACFCAWLIIFELVLHATLQYVKWRKQ